MNIFWKEIDERRYDEMLNVLPPMMWNSWHFMVSEPISHRTCTRLGLVCATYSAFAIAEGRFFQSQQALTRAEFQQITQADVLANIEEVS